VTGVQVRSADPDDLDHVVTLEARVFGEEAWSPRSVEAEFDGIGHTRVVLVAEVAGSVVGYAALMYVGDTGDVQRVAVDTKHRHRGLGTHLVRRLFAAARELGLSELLLEVRADNLAAVGLYERLGFASIDRRPGYYAGGHDAVVMRRRMRAAADG
jgi:ribosomal-protein-alanine N-acetyltransferase